MKTLWGTYQHPLRLRVLGSGAPAFFGRGIWNFGLIESASALAGHSHHRSTMYWQEVFHVAWRNPGSYQLRVRTAALMTESGSQLVIEVVASTRSQQQTLVEFPKMNSVLYTEVLKEKRK